MKNLFAAALLAGAATFGATIAATPADAAEGCGRGYHRGPAGHCRPNMGNRVYVAPGRLVIGNYYASRGYWDGRRYWQHRYRHGPGGWRYR